MATPTMSSASAAATQNLGLIYKAINEKFPNWQTVPVTHHRRHRRQVAYDATHSMFASPLDVGSCSTGDLLMHSARDTRARSSRKISASCTPARPTPTLRASSARRGPIAKRSQSPSTPRAGQGARAEGGGVFDYSGVGEAMPESIGRERIMDRYTRSPSRSPTTCRRSRWESQSNPLPGLRREDYTDVPADTSPTALAARRRRHQDAACRLAAG